MSPYAESNRSNRIERQIGNWERFEEHNHKMQTQLQDKILKKEKDQAKLEKERKKDEKERQETLAANKATFLERRKLIETKRKEEEINAVESYR